MELSQGELGGGGQLKAVTVTKEVSALGALQEGHWGEISISTPLFSRPPPLVLSVNQTPQDRFLGSTPQQF